PWKSLNLFTCGGRFVEFDGQLRVLREARAVGILDQIVHGVLRLWIHQTAVRGNCEVYTAHRCSPFSFKQASSTSAANDSDAAFFLPWTSVAVQMRCGS